MYMRYYMYMKMYTVSEFRKNIKEALDIAFHGVEPVVIMRGDQVFTIMRSYLEVSDGNKVKINTPLEGGKVELKEQPQVFNVLETNNEERRSANIRPDIPKTPDEVAEDLNRKIASDAFRGKKFEYCSHGQVKGLCKKGCR
jgi:hypothetical protein